MYLRMEDFGYSRLVSRVHFRSDVYAGDIAGEIVYGELLKNEEFIKDRDKVKTCFEKIAKD